MASLAARLDSIVSLAVGVRIEEYVQILREILAQNEADWVAVLRTFLQHTALARANTMGAGLIVGREVLATFTAQVHEAHANAQHALADTDTYLAVLRTALAQVEEQAASLEDEIAQIRVQLAEALETQGAWAEAAEVLQGIASDANRRNNANQFWLQINAHILRLLLQAGNVHDADFYAKKANSLTHIVAAEGTDADTERVLLQFRESQACLYDEQLRFYDAAVRYYELSMSDMLAQDARDAMLAKAAIAAVLSPVSAQRRRILAELVQDARAHALPYAGPLKTAAKERILRPHDRALLMQGMTMSQTARDRLGCGPCDALLEHNVYAASRVYTAITMQSLAELLERPVPECERLVGRMIVQGSLPEGTRLHQVEGAVYFGKEGEAEVQDAGDEEHAAMSSLDAQVEDGTEEMYACRDARIAATTAYLSEAYAAMEQQSRA
ncbi:hypothetical protein MVES1_004000 [Malassezia vespertilionis]|uniref:COP9 signalosome complex subunit 4 n=1 Tax=Malassezia vespertilionis TaxID=2020962 RepID=A0A2N1J7M7_9BASI|nr:uncharacterized protein MVES1_004000 [Malassezia vespertilionis]PKI82550.1 hypothetical protein MVES_003548 [Malassezia vespertilionis]WFD08624.1 hypothetical protein MVES1_004000 [Malassezia vespertilionis]